MWKWKGEDGGAYFPGVPMRDMTDDEFNRARDLVPGIEDSPLYEYQDDREHPRLAARAEETARIFARGADEPRTDNPDELGGSVDRPFGDLSVPPTDPDDRNPTTPDGTPAAPPEE